MNDDLIPILTEAVAEMANQSGGPPQSVISNLSNLLGVYGSGVYSTKLDNLVVPWASALKKTTTVNPVFSCSKPIDESVIEGNGRCMHCHDGKCLMTGDCEYKFKEGDI